MGVCLSAFNANKEITDVPISAKQNNSNQKGVRKIKRIKTKFPKKGKNVSDDEDEEEEKSQDKKEGDKANGNDNNNNNK